MWNWLTVRPERLIVTVGAIFFLGVAALLYEMNKTPSFPMPPRIAYSEPYTAEVHEAWQANCERLRQPGRQCGD